MRLAKFFGVTCVLFCSASCKSRSYSGTHDAEVEKQKSVVVFNWSTNAGSLKSHLRNQTEDAFQKNETITSYDKRPAGGTMGYGLYTAIDPFISFDYGEDLSCITFRPNTKLVANEMGEEEESLNLIRSKESVVLYRWVPSPLYKVEFSAAVVRDIKAIDQNRSQKFSLRSVGSMKGLSAQKLAEGRDALRENNLCKALSVYEGEFGSLVYSLLAAGVDWKIPRRYNSAAIYVTKIPGRRTLGTEFFPDVAAAVRAIGQDEALVQELAERRFLVNATPENLELLLSEALLAMLAFPPADRDTQLTKKVLSQSGFLDIKYTGDNAEELWRSISAAFGEKMEKWKKDHPEDIEFAEELWKEMSASRLLPSEF